MKPFFSAAIVLASVTISAISPARAQEANPILLELRPQLQAVMQKVAPDATWELKGNELTASYKTKEFTIYTISPGSHVASQAHQEIGPLDGGFILRVCVFSQLPDFAARTPRDARQAYWQNYRARYNLRTKDEFASTLPAPKLLQSEWESEWSNDRLIIFPITRENDERLRRLEYAGLLESRRLRFENTPSVERYDAAHAIARLQENMPELLGNKATRLKALKRATDRMEKNLSADELQSLDVDVRELQTEFVGEIAKLGVPYSTGPAHGGPQPQEPKVIAAKVQYVVVTLSQGLRTKLIDTNVVLDRISTLVQTKNKEADDK